VDQGLRRQLAAIVGEAAVSEDGSVIRPASPELAAAVMEALGVDTPLRILSRPASAVDAPAGGAVLTLCDLTAIDVSPGALVARVQAGVTVASLVAALAGTGLTAVGLAQAASPTSETAIGSLVAAGSLSRRSLCGITLVPPGGGLVRVGGVLKDVVGYDLCGLMLGSGGELGAVLAVDLRLTPVNADVEPGRATGIRPRDALADALATSIPRSR